MSKIFNVRLPNAVAQQYDPQQFNQLVRSLEQVILQLNSTYTSFPDQNTSGAAAWFGGGGGAAGGGFAGSVRGFQPSTGLLLPYAMLMSEQDQANVGTTSENLITFDSPIFEYGIKAGSHTAVFTGTINDGTPPGAGTVLTVSAVTSGPILVGMTITGTGITAGTRIVAQVSGTTGGTGVYTVSTSQEVGSITINGSRASKILFDYPGQYLINFRTQVSNQDNAVGEFEVWAKNTGVNYPLSNTRFDMAARKSGSIWSHIVPAISGIFTVNDPTTEYLEMAWWSDRSGAFLEYYPAGTSPTRPAIPSVILTAVFASAEMY
jgi:hypothetical protein